MAKKSIYEDMFTLRKDGRYLARYTDETGRHYIYDKDPEKLFYKLQSAQKPKEYTFGKIAEMWEREHREEITTRTWKNYEHHYANILSKHGHKSMVNVTALDVVNHLTAAKAEGYSATVVNSIRSIYRMIFDYAIVHNYAQYNPVTSVRLPKGLKRGRRTAPTDEQLRTICSNINAHFGLFPFFLLCTGMRKSEALALTWEDVDFKNRKITVSKSLDYTVGANPQVKSPKTEAGNRTVPIIDILYDPLLQAHSERTADYLFPAQPSNRSGKGGGLMTLRGYEGAWHKYCTEVGLVGNDGKPVIGAHNLRHGTATLMFELGVDELTTQHILGHSRIEITREIYTELRAEQNRSSVDKFNAGMRKYMSTE